MSLVLTQPLSSYAVFTLSTGSYLVGRADEAHVKLMHWGTSRRHASLRHEGGQWLVEDLGSRNGTYVNGSPVLEPTPVEVGDVLIFGGGTLVVKQR